VAVEVQDGAAIQRAAAQTAGHFGDIQIVVASAGVESWEPSIEILASDIEK
jgi:NAD(P)-dependent dehydrogenase (short-subunit alcohol dehydrogenase family)